MIGALPDTIADRAIHIEMRRRLPQEQIESMRDTGEHFTTLKRQIVRWSQDHISDVKGARPAMPAGLHDRAIDNRYTMIAIADIAGGHWPARARQAVTALAGHDHEASLNCELLSDIREVFERRNVDRISSADLIEALVQDEESPWPMWNRGKPITARQVAKRLREFGITPNQTIRLGTTTAKGYMREQFTEAFVRYLTGNLSVTRSQPSNDAAFREIASVTGRPAVTDRIATKPSIGAACDRVTDVTDNPEGIREVEV